MKTKAYVNNKKMYEVLCAYLEECNKAEKEGKELPRIPEYIGACFLKIATNFASKPRFSGYSYTDEMINEAVLTCVTYVRRFNPEITHNPFAYFTQFVKNAFFQYIDIEQTHQYRKYLNSEISYGNEPDEIARDFVSNFEKLKQQKKEEAKERALARANTVTSLYE